MGKCDSARKLWVIREHTAIAMIRRRAAVNDTVLDILERLWEHFAFRQDHISLFAHTTAEMDSTYHITQVQCRTYRRLNATVKDPRDPQRWYYPIAVRLHGFYMNDC